MSLAQAQPQPSSSAVNGGNLVVQALLAQQVEQVFCVPGESYLPVLDALYDVADQVRLTVCRQEGGAAFMADAYAKLSGKPGVVMVTRGPGATNASIGVHTAQQDSTPLVLFVGQVGLDIADREAFQEVDYEQMFGKMAKWVATIEATERIPEYVARAFQVAQAGRPGPVVIVLPEDVLQAEIAPIVSRVAMTTPASAASAQDLQTLQAHLARAQRPLVLVGGSVWGDEQRSQLVRFAESNQLPVATTLRRQDRFDNHHDHYAGYIGLGMSPVLAKHVRQADLLLVLGDRIDESSSATYSLITPQHEGQVLIHVYPDANELGRVFACQQAICATTPAFMAQLHSVTIPASVTRERWVRQLNDDYRADLQPPPGSAKHADLGAIVHALNTRLKGPAVITNGAGNYTGWVQRYLQFSAERRQLAPTSGAMGYGVPAGVAAQLARPDCQVISFSGDGCFLMNGQELATAAQYHLPVLFIVVNNGMYGTIRMHQERHYPGRVSGTALSNPDFVALARAYGAHAEKVESTADFLPAYERAMAHDGPALLEIVVDPAVMTSRDRG